MQVIIMRGITGSGKSRLVSKIFRTATVVSADQWFEKNNRKWNPGHDLKVAHDTCYMQFCAALDRKDPLVVVDNTNVKAIDYGDYVEEALDAGYEVTFMHVMCDPDVARHRTKHASSMDKQPPENVRKGLWKQHMKLLETPGCIDSERVFSTEVWTSKQPEMEPEEVLAGAEA
jgi:predicted kinase